ncbi:MULTISPECIES: helix-turn-helix domain-containing protein [Enterobacterales]|uniref:helix-turn-helix domain-containing protein n=1 Tax=Enterobacterales TaxID=91347 RepID=UPI001F1E0656|nr:helix-turn-helix transcriptional regulator [Hafnia alvei]MCA7370602.1 helix-turn-helix transcriptional regulator [Escherichia coli]MCE9870272.1 helix-turn-helix transcriptional regulator [Hafnia alvei]
MPFRRRIDSSKPIYRQNRCCKNGSDHRFRFPSGPLEELTEVAERMGITQPAVSKLEKNASKASVTTLERYAAACGASIKIVMG